MPFTPSNRTITAPSGASVIKFGRNTPPAAPVAEFIGAPLAGTVPLAVTMTNQSTGSIDTHAWVVRRSGTITHTSSSANPTFVFAEAGTYDVELTVTGPGGSNTRTRSGYVVAASGVTPGAVFTAVEITSPASETRPFSFGHAFAQGDLPAGAQLNGLQTAVKSTWPDGSAKFAVVAGTALLTADTPLSLDLRTGNPISGAALDTEDLKATGLTAEIDAGSVGFAAWSGTDWDTPHETWVSGPAMSSWRFRKPVGSDANVVAWLEVRLWASGAVEVLPWLENGYVYVAGCTSISETFTFTLAGTQRESITATMPGRTRMVLITGTKLGHWAGAEKAVFVQHDTAYLRATKLVPNYAKDVAAGTVSAWSDTITLPHEQGLYRAVMSAGGGSIAIGLLPQWDVAAVTGGGEKAWRVCQQHAYRAGRYGVHNRDENTLRVPRLSDHPTAVIGKNNQGVKDTGVTASGIYSSAQAGATPPEWAVSHLTSMGYVAALLTGRRFHCETVQFNAMMCTAFQSTTYRQNGAGVMSTDSFMQVRGVAWGIRTVAQATVVSADADPLQAEFESHLNATINYNHTKYVAQPNHPFGIMKTGLPGLGDYEAGDPRTHAQWMHDFVVSALGYARHLTGDGLAESAKLSSFFDWIGKSVTYRLGLDAGPTKWPYIDAADYAFVSAATEAANWSDGSGPWPASPGELWDMTYLAGTEGRNNVYLQNNPPTIRARDMGDGSLRGGYVGNAFSYWHNMLPALAYCVEFAIPGAAEGYDAITNAPNYTAGVVNQGSSEQWLVEPRAGLLASWAAGPEVGSLSSGLWTPGRDAEGRITQASVDALPANQWVRVAGTEWSVLQGLVEASGFSPYASYDFGTNKTIRSTFYSWVGACDDGRRMFFPRGGGHVDSSVNGLFALDLLKMGWEVTKQPSRHDAVGAEWSAGYKVTGGAGSFTRYEDSDGVLVDADGLYWDRLPDNTPTSAHTYDGIWYDSLRQEIGTTRISKWVFNRNTGQWARTRWTWNGAAPAITTINASVHYHAGNDALYGCLGRVDGGDTSFGKCPGGTAAWVSMAGPGFSWVNYGMSSVRLDADRVLWQWGVGGQQRWAIYNMALESWEGAGLTGNTKPITYASEMMAAIYIPTWGAEGQVIMRGTADGIGGQWWAFDIATKANVTYTPAGDVPGAVSWPGNKYRSFPRLGIAIAFNDSNGSSSNASQAVHVMRYV